MRSGFCISPFDFVHLSYTVDIWALITVFHRFNLFRSTAYKIFSLQNFTLSCASKILKIG